MTPGDNAGYIYGAIAGAILSTFFLGHDSGLGILTFFTFIGLGSWIGGKLNE